MPKRFADKKMICVKFLAEKPHFLPIIAKWVYDEWYDQKIRTLPDVINYYSHFLNTDKIPLSLVAIDGHKPTGTICLWENDLKSHKYLRPWLSALFVPKEYRNRGVGRLLTNSLISVSAGLGYKNLYLRTETASAYYAKLGWDFLEETVNDKGEKTLILKKKTM